MGEFFKSAFDYLSSINPATAATSTSAPQRTPSDPFVGQTVRIETYDICVSAVIAQGGFGIVFAGYDEKTNKPVALKRLVTERSHESYAEAKQEINILKQLNANGGHPNILKLLVYGCMKSHELGLAPNRDVFLIATERCYGGVIDLLNAPGVNRQNPLPIDDVVKIFYQTCQAVKHMHSQQPPLIHRDLKIENLLFSSERTVRLCDFGSSTVDTYDVNPDWSGNQRRLMETEMQRHTTPRYRSPEILDPYLNYPVNEMLDIWALGVVLFTLCYVIPPFEDEAKLQILNGKYVIPASDVRFKNCQPVIKKLLQLDPRARPTIRTVVEDVAAVAETEHVTDINAGIKTRLAALDEASQSTGVHAARSAPNMRTSPTLADDSSATQSKVSNAKSPNQQHLTLSAQQAQTPQATAAAVQEQAGAILNSVKSGAGLFFKNIKIFFMFSAKQGQVLQHVNEIRTAAGPGGAGSADSPRASDYQHYEEDDDRSNATASAGSFAPALQPRANQHSDSSRAHRPHSETRRGVAPPPRPEPPRELRGTLPVPPYGGDSFSNNNSGGAKAPPRPPKPTTDGIYFSHDVNNNQAAPPRPPKPEVFSQQPTQSATRRVPAAPSLDEDTSDADSDADISSDDADSNNLQRRSAPRDVRDAGANSRSVAVENLLPDFANFEQQPQKSISTPKSPDADLLNLETSAAHSRLTDETPLGSDSPQKRNNSFSNVDLFSSGTKPVAPAALVKEANLLGDFDVSSDWTDAKPASRATAVSKQKQHPPPANDQIFLLDTESSTNAKAAMSSAVDATSNLIGDFSDMNLDAVYNSSIQNPAAAGLGNTYSGNSPLLNNARGDSSKSSSADLLGDLKMPQQSLPPTLFAQQQKKPTIAATDRDPLASFINLDFSLGATSSVPASKLPMNAAVGSRIGSGPPSATITPTSSTTNFNQKLLSSNSSGSVGKSPVNKPNGSNVVAAENFDDLLGFTIPTPANAATGTAATQQSSSPTIRASAMQQPATGAAPVANNFGANFLTRPASNSKLSGTGATDGTPSSGSASGGMFDDLLGGHKFSAQRAGAGQSMGAQRRDQQLKEGVLTPEELKVRDWTQGKEGNIRALLSSLHTVLWPEETRWKPVGIHELIDDDRIRRVYLKACVVVHPDKMNGLPQEPLAKAIFVELNRAWDDFNKHQSGR